MENVSLYHGTWEDSYKKILEEKMLFLRSMHSFVTAKL